ncbi:MAG: DUF975 family protein [Blautia sp.]|nr:DUF975 family protein [Blautia sp.]
MQSDASQTQTAVEGEITQEAASQKKDALSNVLGQFVLSGKQSASELADKIEEKEIEKAEGRKVFQRNRGALASIVNNVASGRFVVILASALNKIVGRNEVSVLILIVLGLLFRFILLAFFANVFEVISSRMSLEARVYEKVPLHRFLYLLRQKKWFSACWTMLVMSFYLILWTFTIVGAIVKFFSYLMVPYIIAENPNLKGREAITLSRKMMDGHKWEAAKLYLSFFGWWLLDALTLGCLGVMFVSPYTNAVFAEYAVYIRTCAKEKGIDGADQLNDVYLYEKPEADVLTGTYQDIIAQTVEEDNFVDERKGILKFFSDNFGVVLINTAAEKAYQDHQAQLLRYKVFTAEAKGEAYPVRLSPIPQKKSYDKKPEVRYARAYSIWTLIIIFFVMSFIGWLWEVSIHVVQDGTFVNRGVLHGPWLPIYGSGCVLILLFLFRFRKNMFLEFVTAVVLCGCVEYFSSLYLELSHEGQKWWDYSGYFINLNGRICAEGLLVFGLGGVAMVYFIAPNLNYLIEKVNTKVLIPVAVVLMVIFASDQVYSGKHPNVGRGITDYANAKELQDYDRTMTAMAVWKDVNQQESIFRKQANVG